ncbi:hypothetical protein [Variovorax sp. dw_308]|uniref:hypothetical protein n=1 Tax=Variovorax sp. dw_308 TaxID=2721546 RepID=UPI001C48932F|nr:hypothetical protein [Variovorax sp. dw_308]
MNVRYRWLGLLACVAMQACTTPPPPAPAAPPPPPMTVAPPPMPAPAPAPGASAPMPAPAPVAQAQPEPVVDIRAVCDGRAEGERLQTRGPGGETLSGICVRGANGWLRFSTNGR